MLSPGTILQDRYHILRQIGGGGMGMVYLAEDTRLQGRRCAIKEMSPTQVPAQDRNWAINAFRQEAQILGRLQHPGITPVTDFFPEKGNWYLVMEFVEGQTLHDVLAASPGGRLPLAQALNILDQLCKVLEYLHAQQPPVVFRDLKPGNVMLTPEGQVKLIDFGIARFFKSGRGRDTVNLGTPGYAAPEQYGGRGQTDVRADVYGLGVLLHQMLTGHTPSIAGHLPYARQLNPAVDAHIADAIGRATEHDPGHRFPSVKDLRTAVIGQTDVLSSSPTRRDALPRWLGCVAGAGVALLLIACAVGAFFVLKPKSAPVPTRTARATRIPTSPPTFTPPAPVTRVVIISATPQAGETPSATSVEVTRIVTLMPQPTASATATAMPTPSPTPLPSATPGSSNQVIYACGAVGDADVCSVNLSSGRSQKLISRSSDDGEPDWSPDRRRIAFQSDRTGSYDIFVADADGGNVRNLTDTSGRDERGPDWSPDGSQILYEVGDGTNNGELWLVDADGDDPHRLFNRTVSGRSPSWAPDGEQVAFMRKGGNGYWQIYVLDLGSGRETQLDHSGEHCRFPTWSPDGRYIAYNTFVFGSSPRGQTYEVWRIPSDGSGSPQRLTSGGDNGRPTWSPDGQHIIYNHGEYLYRIGASGQNAERLSSTEQGWAADW